MSVDRRLEAALAYARRGWYVFPCCWIEDTHCSCGKIKCDHPGKHPLNGLAPHGVHDASSNPAIIEKWWARQPKANVAIAAGASKLIVFDIDPRHGGDEAALRALAGDEISNTVRVLSPSGGLHLYYQQPSGGLFTCFTNKPAPGIDIRGGAGYVIGPPSNHLMGEYLFEVGYNPGEIELLPCPPVLADLARRPPEQSGGPSASDAGDQATGFDILHALTGVPEGERNDQLFRAACSFRATNTAKKVAMHLCREAAEKCDPPFPRASVEQIVNRVFRRYKCGAAQAGAGQRPEAGATTNADVRSQIFVDQGQLRDKVTQAVAALDRANNPPLLFIRGGILTRLGRDGDTLDALDSDGLLAELSEDADWLKHGAEGAVVDAEPPPNVIRGIRGRRWLPFPAIEGVARAPFFSERGELVLSPGFHSDARIYLALDSKLANELANQRFSGRPTTKDVDAARQLLCEPFSQFPFADKASLAHTIGLMLLPFVRRMIDGPVPIHGVVAPPDAAGTGKGLLVQTACVPGMGEVPATPEVGNGDELRKKLLPVIFEDLSIFLFDNVTTELKGGVLASILTARNWADRFLGRSQLFRGRVSTAFVFTANGPRCSTEIRRRTNWIRLNARDPEPWRRTGFAHVLPGWAFEHRAELIMACITLVRHWQALGCAAPASAANLGSFERWAAIIGGILEAADIASFLSNIDDESVREADETGSRWRGFVEDWWREHGEHAVTPGALIDLALGHSIIRENKDGEREAKARSAATRLGLTLNRRVGEAFEVRDDDLAAHVIALTRAKVERAKGGEHRGFALKLAERPPINVGDVGEQQEDAEKPAQAKEISSANDGGASPTFSDNVGGLQVINSEGKSQHPPTSPTLRAGFSVPPDGVPLETSNHYIESSQQHWEIDPLETDDAAKDEGVIE